MNLALRVMMTLIKQITFPFSFVANENMSTVNPKAVRAEVRKADPQFGLTRLEVTHRLGLGKRNTKQVVNSILYDAVDKRWLGKIDGNPPRFFYDPLTCLPEPPPSPVGKEEEERKTEEKPSVVVIQHRYINELMAENQRLKEENKHLQDHIAYLQRQIK